MVSCSKRLKPGTKSPLKRAGHVLAAVLFPGAEAPYVFTVRECIIGPPGQA
jgi:hypothetical protein